jgi:hypothetical protein
MFEKVKPQEYLAARLRFWHDLDRDATEAVQDLGSFVYLSIYYAATRRML